MIYILTFFITAVIAGYLAKVNARFAIAVSALILASFAALRGPDVASDFLVYQDWYLGRDISNGYLERPGLFEAVYFFLNDLFEASGAPFRFFVWFVAFVSIFIKISVLHYFSKSVFAFCASLVTYLLAFYLLHEFTQIRVGIAIAFIFLAIRPLVIEKRGLSLLFILIATGFHSSALVAFFLLLPRHGVIANWIDRGLEATALGTVAMAALGINIASGFIDLFSAFDPRIALYVVISEGLQAEPLNPFAIRSISLFVLVFLTLSINSSQVRPFNSADRHLQTVILVRRSILVGLIFLFTLPSIPDLSIRLFEINVALFPILAAVIFSYRGRFIQKSFIVSWASLMFYTYVFLNDGLVQPYILFFM